MPELSDDGQPSIGFKRRFGCRLEAARCFDEADCRYLLEVAALEARPPELPGPAPAQISVCGHELIRANVTLSFREGMSKERRSMLLHENPVDHVRILLRLLSSESL